MRRMHRTAAPVALALLVLSAPAAWAQTPEHGTPTRAGTTIENKATVQFTDANDNTYAPVEASVSLTVAFTPGVSIAGPAIDPTPESPSAGNTIQYTITNFGNDFDSYALGVNPGSGITVTGYFIGAAAPVNEGDWVTDLATFNIDLADEEIDYHGNNGHGATIGTPNPSELTVWLRYDVDPNQGPTQLEVTATSTTDGTGEDTETTPINPELAYGVTVTATDTVQTNLPSADPAVHTYTATFAVHNQASGNAFDWEIAVAPGADVTVASVTGTGVTGGPANGSLTLEPGETVTVSVTYTIASGAVAGSAEAITLTVTSTAEATATDSDETTVRVIRPSLTVTKEAFADNAGDPGAQITGDVVPTQVIWYRITVSNTDAHGAPATNVVITDVLPDMLAFGEARDDDDRWQISHDPATRTVTAIPVDATGMPNELAVNETAVFWIKVTVR